MSHLSRAIRISIQCLAWSCAALGHARAQHPDFSGVWQATTHSAPLQPLSGAVPLSDAATSIYDPIQSKTKSGDRSWDSVNECIPPGIPRAMAQPYPIEVFQESGKITLLFELQRLNRIISLTGHSNATSDPTFMGTSLGHWDGDTLVIETDNFKTGTFINDAGIPHSDQLKVTERWSLASSGTLKDRITIEDPKAFIHPWDTELTLKRLKHASFPEDVCVDRIKAKH